MTHVPSRLSCPNKACLSAEPDSADSGAEGSVVPCFACTDRLCRTRGLPCRIEWCCELDESEVKGWILAPVPLKLQNALPHSACVPVNCTKLYKPFFFRLAAHTVPNCSPCLIGTRGSCIVTQNGSLHRACSALFCKSPARKS